MKIQMAPQYCSQTMEGMIRIMVKLQEGSSQKIPPANTQ